MTETSRIRDELARAFDGDPWHGPNLRTILQGVKAIEAAAHPLPTGHSIWEIALHISAWVEETRQRLGGNVSAEPAAGDWPRVVESTDEAWAKAIAGLTRAHEDLLRDLALFPEDRLWETVGSPIRSRAEGTGTSYYVMLHGLVQHNVYHSAQIGLLRRLVEKG